MNEAKIQRASQSLAPTLALILLLASGVSCSRERTPKETGDRTLGSLSTEQAEDLFKQAETLRLQYEYDASRQAIEKYRACRNAWEQAGELDRAVEASQRLGDVHEQSGDLEAALENYQQGLELAREAEDPVLESLLLSDVGMTHILLGDPEAAEQECDRAANLARDSADRRPVAAAHLCVGELEYFRGDLDRAIASYRGALTEYQHLADIEGQAQSLLYLGYAHSDRSEFQEASGYFRDALRLWRSLPDRRGEGLTLVALGRLHQRLGEYQTALNHFHQAMPLIEAMGDAVWQASIYAGMGSVYYRLAEHEQAGDYWSQALDLFREAGLQMAEVDLLESVGQIHLARGDPAAALVYFEEALVLAQQIDSPRWEAHSLRFLGLAHEAQGDSARAIEFLKQSLEIHRSVDDHRYEAYALGELGRVYQSQGEAHLARECYRGALSLSQTSDDRVGESIGYFNLARLAHEQEIGEARTHIDKALAIAESLRSGVESHELRSSYLAAIQQYYKLQIDVLMHLHADQPAAGYEVLAFEASERARARSLLESLAEAGVDVRTGVDSDLLARERQLKLALDIKAEQQFRNAGDSGEESPDALDREIDALNRDYDLLQAEIRSRSPRYASLTQPEPLRLQVVQKEVVDGDTIILEYSLGEERSFLWTIEKDRLEVVELPPKQQIESVVQEAFRHLTARLPESGESVQQYRTRVRGADQSFWKIATELSDLLLAPVAGRLQHKRIVVVSDGALQYLPFAALPVPDGGENPIPLIVAHEVVNLPSVSALGVIRRESKGRETLPLSVAVLADPVFELDDPRFGAGMVLAKAAAPTRSVASSDVTLSSPTEHALRDVDFIGEASGGIPRLVATRREAQAIVAAAPKGMAMQALDFAASRERAMRPDLGQYRIIHFATHGVVNNEHPGLSGILLSMVDEQGISQNGFLRLHDIYNLELPVELVVLSACNTALGKPVEGEGLVGLVRGFMYAGARRVVASLWKVDDEATGELMGLFYKEMLQEGRTPAAALRQAQLTMSQEGDWQSPFYWAAFVLQGEWM